MLALARSVVTRSILRFVIRLLTLCERNLPLPLLAILAGRGRAAS